MDRLKQLIQSGDFSNAIALASDVMNGNQDIQTALTKCQESAKQAADDKAAALALVPDGD